MQNPESIPGENLNCYQVPDSAGLTEDSPQQKGQEFFQTSFRSSTRLMRWTEAWRCNGVLMFYDRLE